MYCWHPSKPKDQRRRTLICVSLITQSLSGFFHFCPGRARVGVAADQHRAKHVGQQLPRAVAVGVFFKHALQFQHLATVARQHVFYDLTRAGLGLLDQQGQPPLRSRR